MLSQRKMYCHIAYPAIDFDEIGLEKSHSNCDYISIEDASTLHCNDKDLVVIQLNIRGLLSKQSELLKLITTCTKDKKVDVVILCETWVTKEVKHLIKVPGYEYVGIERENKKGGGVGFLIANKLHYKIRNKYSLK